MRKRLPALLVVLLFLSGPGAQFGGSEAGGGDRGIELFDDSDVWTDPLDDLSHVYVPPGGLVRTEVTGGQAQLKAGQSTGWIASSVISAKAGMRYDYVFIDAHTPGNSYINVSILNASEETTEIGFANETIWGFKLQEGPYLSISSISWRTYPDIRIQANLVADGTDRPVLYAWSLHYLGLEVWRDDFLWPGKIADHRGLNFTGDALEVNLTSMSGSGGGSYEEFPTIVCSGEYPGVDVFYANAQLDGYEDRSIVNLGAWSNSMTYDDLNGDGYYDLVVEMWVGRLKLLWGSASGTWSNTGATTMNDPSGPQEVATGDFDGDGEVDLVVAQSSNTRIYLNKGEGSFVDSADITIPMGGSRVSTGDLDGDGYDDILVSVSGDAKVFMGGDGGPDTTADITFTTSNCGDTLIEDVDGDGHLDVILGERNGGKANVYLGSRSGPDTTADHTLTVSDNVGACEAGDLNGDGYTDLIYYTGSGSSYRMEIFEGGPTGWSDSRKHTDITHDNSGDALCVADLDKDGYEDLLQIQSVGGSSYNLKIWFGDNSWPSTPDISKTTGYDNSVVAMVPKGSGGSRAYRGTLTTEPITLPSPYEQKWDMLDLVGSMPMNTTMTVSVLDAVTEDPIAGYEDLSSWNLDLSGIDPELHRVIQVEVTIASEFNTTTPVLDRILVKWMDRRVWRDEFYGAGKVERMLNLDVTDGQLGKGSIGGPSPDLIFPSLRGDDYYNTTPLAFSDAGANDYLAWKPLEFNVRGTSAADTADVNNDGYLDIVFSVQQTAARVFGTQSPLYLGGPLGMAATPEHRFDTTGASDVVLEDINADGYMDVVFAQMQKAFDDFSVNSTLYWGSADGWSDTPDVEFATKGASDVEVFDLDNDDDLDLAFACYRDSGTLTDSMVFLQGTNGFCATAPDHTMLTRGATAVAAGDLDNDGNVDLVFANSIYQGSAEIDSYILWGRPGPRWDVLPEGLATSGATDVKVVDLDGDGRLDIVFANYWDDSIDYEVDSVAYIATTNPREFTATAATMVPTTGATAVAVVDLDGTGWKDLVFSCQRNVTTYKVPSVVYLGGASGWSDTPDIEIPTEGASGVVATRLSEYGTGGYLSVPIAVDDPLRDTGTLHTLRYSANLGASISGKVSILDSYTLEVLGETSLRSGTNEWDVSGLFRVSEHPVIRIMMVTEGLESPGSFDLDDLWLNWTRRVMTPPRVLGLGVSEPSIYRLASTELWIEVADDYDLPGELMLVVQHRINGTDTWEEYLVDSLVHDEATGNWSTTITPMVNAAIGTYDFRVDATDLDSQFSGWVEFPGMLEVLNNLPTAPVVHLMPLTPVTTTQLRVEMDASASDLETAGLQYVYRWYLDGVLVENLTGDLVPSYHTAKGQNWSVEVSAWDGDDEGPRAAAWVLIRNAPPSTNMDLPDPDIDEDTSDSDWLDLSVAFKDEDGDPITWSLASESENLTVTIDHDTGVVTLTPKANWNGEVTLVFVASDGEDSFSQRVTVTVNPVNDPPTIAFVDGVPPATDPLVYTMKQGETLVIRYDVADIEGDEVQALVNTTAVIHDEEARTITFEPGFDAVGTLRFGLRIWDIVSPDEKVALNFVIIIENENDPMSVPQITSPLSGEKFKVNQSFSLVAFADDPDIQFGQELLYVWTSNISGELGRGPSITVQILEPGTHEITVTVSDPDYTKSTFIVLYIEPEEVVGPPDDDDPIDTPEGTNWFMIAAILVVLVIVGAVLFVVVGKRRTEAYEERMDAEMVEEEKAESMKRAHAAIKELADEWEGDVADGKTEAKAEAAGWEAETDDYEEIEMAGPADGQLTMEASVTGEASKDVEKLFAGGAAAATVQTEEEKAAMRLENEKRTYQNAIGRLPYGIPSKELADRDWVDLAAALATGEKKTVEGGVEVTNIEGRWYYSDAKDTGTFLKEHGAKPKAAPRKAAAPAAGKEALLAKLEERFILGEISEEAYMELKEKYEK